VLEDFDTQQLEKWGQDLNEIIFFLSNYFSSLTPSHFFEISRRLVSNFLALQNASSARSPSPGRQ
jgi:hypothetical protein